MEAYRRSVEEGKAVFVGVDLHRFKWHVTVRTEDELFSGTVPAHWEALRRLLDRWQGCSVRVVYEAGYFGFWLYDRVIGYGGSASSPHRVSCLRSMAIGSRRTGETVGSWPIFYPKGC